MTTDLARPLQTLYTVVARRSFRRFLDYVYIEEPPTLGNPGTGKIKMLLWPHILEIVQALTKAKLLVLGKARQIGASWVVAAYVVWFASYHPNAVVILLSRGHPDARKLLDKCKTIWRYLPSFLKTDITNGEGKEGTETLIEMRNGSSIEAMASTQDAGRSVAASLVVQDESDFHEYLEANYAAVKPTIDSSGGQMVMISTSNKRKMLSLFKAIFRGAPDNGWAKVFVPYNARPGRDEEWYQEVRANVPAEALEGMNPDLYMEQEYPRNEHEFLAPSRALMFFDADAVQRMEAKCEVPRRTERGIVQIWRETIVAAKYIISGDVSWGSVGAFSCAHVWHYDVEGFEQVAEMHGRPEHDEYAQIVKDLHDRYNRAYIVVEANGEREQEERGGMNVVNKLIDLGLGRFMYHRGENWEDQPEKRGWWTTKENRIWILGQFEEAVRHDQIVVRCKDFVGEMYSFLRNERNRPKHAEGAYDDHVMAGAIGWEIRKSARFDSFTSEPLVVRGFYR